MSLCSLPTVYFIHLSSSLNWCIHLPPYFCRSEMLRNLLNVVQEKNIEDQLDRLFEKWINVKKRQGGNDFLYTIRKDNWTGHILRRNCVLKHVTEWQIEGRIEMTGSRGRWRKQLLDDLKEKRRYGKLIAEALEHILWRTRFGRSYVPVVR